MEQGLAIFDCEEESEHKITSLNIRDMNGTLCLKQKLKN